MLGRVLLRCGAPTIIRPVTRTVVLPIRTYATPGRPKSVVGEPSRPVKRAVKKAAAKPADGSSPAEKNVAAKAKSKKKAPKKLTEEEKTALKERQAKVKARRQVVIEKEKLQALKKAALEPPKVERDNPYAAFTKEKNKTLGPITRQSDETAAKAFADRISAIGAEWKSMGAADREVRTYARLSYHRSNMTTALEPCLSHGRRIITSGVQTLGGVAQRRGDPSGQPGAQTAGEEGGTKREARRKEVAADQG
jgi:hypothetical protein